MSAITDGANANPDDHICGADCSTHQTKTQKSRERDRNREANYPDR